MLFTYPLVHITRSSLVANMKKLGDEYLNGTATDQEVAGILTNWKNTSPNLMFDIKGGNRDKLVPQITKQIGSRRTKLFQTMLDNLQE